VILWIVVPLILLLSWYGWEKQHRKTHPMDGGIHRDIALPHEQEYELYHNALSLCSKKVRVCLVELGIDFKGHHIDLIETGSYEVISRHFLAVNPSGLVPVLLHRGRPIYESHDIIAYCAEQAGPEGAQLLPPGEADRALMQHWVSRASLEGDDPLTNIEASAANCVALLTTPLFCAGVEEIAVPKILEGLLFHRIKFRPFLFLLLKLNGLAKFHKMAPLMKQLGRGREHMGHHLDALEQHLAGHQPWICGEQFSLADVSWMVIFERLCEADWFDYFLGEAQRPLVLAYWQRLKARPGYALGIDGYRHSSVQRATERIRQRKLVDSDFKAALEV